MRARGLFVINVATTIAITIASLALIDRAQAQESVPKPPMPLEAEKIKPKPIEKPLAHPIRCNGKGSIVCSASISFRGCEQSIRFHWEPVRVPVNLKGIDPAQSWCDVVWETAASSVQRKLEPVACQQIVQLLHSAALQFRRADVAAAHCAVPAKVDQPSIAGESNSAHSQTTVEVFVAQVGGAGAAPPVLDPQLLVQLDGAASCIFDAGAAAEGKNSEATVSPPPRILRCPVLPATTFRWLTALGKVVGVRVEMRNRLR